MAGFNLHGKWELLKERSESLYSHMKAMGTDEVASLASEKLHINLHIIHGKGENTIKVYQCSQLGVTMRTLQIGEEIEEQFTAFPRRVRVTPEGNSGLLIETSFKEGYLKDHRELLENGSVMKSSLELTMKGSSVPIKTVRYFKRIGDQPEQEIMARASNIPDEMK